MNPDRAKQDAIPFDGGGLYEPIPGMMIVEHAKIQFIAAALTGLSGSDRHAQWSVGEIAAEAIFYADAALKAGGYIR